jgi:hypothetical protein
VSSKTTRSSTATTRATTGSESSHGRINFDDDGSGDDLEMDELETYFDAPRSRDADLVQWWYARKAEYPHLYQFARDIMSISGTLVQIFWQCKGKANELSEVMPLISQ